MGAKKKDPRFTEKVKFVMDRILKIKKDTPTDEPAGWRADPHQGGHNGINWR